ncbi:CASP8-associated protein 2 isoform X2 [Mastacembelus armatus]|uniref:CASP8-associated protein 2 isoform X2 n=1 Tax=Mastacembelus armatus TaxID=205130 RepID=UPI000E457622|nr:CASP8-associated protein 2 isoform X2 [Mastacembelus armatus]
MIIMIVIPDVNEDSVDIYDGLDIGFSNDAVKSPPNASQLKESMDLYEEIVTEEQQSRESSYLELQSRFQAAQNQIKELRRTVEQLEIQNTGLNAENCRLKKNISALLHTARKEVTRKDAEIQRLNQQLSKGHCHHQSHVNNLRDQNSFRWTPTGSSSTNPPPSVLVPAPPSPSSLPLLQTSPPRVIEPSKDSPSRKQSNNSINQSIGSSTESKASKASSSNSKSSARGYCRISDKKTEHSVSKFNSSSSSRHSGSDKHKFKRREEKYKNHKLSESTERRHRTGSDASKECQDRNRSHRADKDTGRNYDSKLCKSRTFLKVEGHHRSDRAKSPPPEILCSAAFSDDTKGGSQAQKQNKAKLATSDSEHSTAHSCKEVYNRDHRKLKTSDGHSRGLDSKDQIKSSSSQHTRRCSLSSDDRRGGRVSKDYQRKEERRHEDDISRKHKRSSLSEMSREHEKQRSNGEVNVHSKERQEETCASLERPSKQPYTSEKSSVEENTPNRKLCFMETLNLTISPMKKPVMSIDARQDCFTSVDKAGLNRSDENFQLHLENMCVIDEVGSSVIDAELEAAADQFPGIRCDDAKDVQEKDKSRSESAAGKLLEDTLGQSTSAQLTAHPKPNQSSSLKLTAVGVSENHEDSTQLASVNQVDQPGPLEATDGVSDTLGNITKPHTSNSLYKVNDENCTDQSVASNEPVVAAASTSRESLVAKDALDNPKSKEPSAHVFPQYCQQGLHPGSSSSIHKKDACDTQEGPKDTEAVTSTISLESLPQEGLSLPEAIYVLTQTNKDADDSIASELSSSTGCIAVSKVSSTTEETMLQERYSDLIFTSKKSFSPGKSLENNAEPSSSVPLLHDEDSMMRTLSNLKRFPDAISPLRSPIRTTKRSHLHVNGKPGHVKSLQNDFSDTAVDVNSKKLDINKENKYPGSPANHNMQNMVDRVCDQPSSLSDPELEEGEILSESDENAANSPAPASKRVKLAQPVRNKPSPKSLLKRKSEEKCVATKEAIETTGTSTRSPKSRFKTVCPAATKASFSNIEEIMETFKLVRTEIRKKYMKLHKTFPKKSFYGMMDNFQESFLEFVDGAHFGQICSQAGELKSRLNKLIASVFSKVLNNGIVKRIFEQQAVDLKQKLWDFVDVQVDYLFKDIHTTLKSLCKPITAQVGDKNTGGNDKISRQPCVKQPPCQQKEAQCSTLNQIKPSSVVPYKTGLGSRGKGIRITHVEQDRNVALHPIDCPSTQTVVDFFSSKNIPSIPEKNNMASLPVSQNGSLLDKTDFQILTEQQATSLTFNLVRDSQMGEIFKCLLQGSDLLESSGITGDSTTWSFSSPRKDGEKLISITTPTKFDSPSKLLSPTKFDTPSKLITTWTRISPRKMLSPRTKDQIQLNPALFDESCLLEVPSQNRATLHSSLASQRSYSILAEDLAVSLTIPSPLKSDSHLSFLQPSSMNIMSTPDSIISAHISEDALLDGEDATEQDIHLSLDTDNSSCGSSSSVTSVALATSFVFQPDVPMQALVMEKSNDHFIVKIRQATTSADITLTADESLSETLKEDQQHTEEGTVAQESQPKVVLSDKLQNGRAPSNAVPAGSNLCNNAESSEVCQDVAVKDVCLTQDESFALTKNQSHKKDTSNQQDASKVCFPEELSETVPSENSWQSSAKTPDHFFVQSRQPLCQSPNRDGVTSTADESQAPHGEDMKTQKSSSKTLLHESQKLISSPKRSVSANNLHHLTESWKASQRSQIALSYGSDAEKDDLEVSESERSLTIAEDVSSMPETNQRDCDNGRKRKKHGDKVKVKRKRKEVVQSTEDVVSNAKKDCNESRSSPGSLSPNSLSANNVIRKKGEVVMAWSRDEDRAILMDLKTKGASRDTFSALSEKLNKPSGQIAHRFYQLMKLFKKQEKMDT